MNEDLAMPEANDEPICPGRKSNGSLGYFGIYPRPSLVVRIYRWVVRLFPFLNDKE